MQELAIDLGTANTLIIYNGKVVVDEPSIIALELQTGKVKAIGTEAKKMDGRVHPNIKTIRPLKDGVIADFKATELMLRGLIKKVRTTSSMFSPSLRMVICIPSGSTNVEIRAVRDSAEHAGARDVYMIFEPMAAALGAGLDVEAPEGNMVIDIGGGTSEIACISLGGIVCSESINVAGDVFTTDIQNYVRQQHNIRIGERTAEEVMLHSEDIKNLWVLPSSIDLVAADTELPKMENGHHVIKNVLEPIRDKFDYILIDCSPSLGYTTVNILTAADSVLIPVQCEYLALEGLSKLLNTIKIVKSGLNPALEIEGFVLTMYMRNRLNNQVATEVREHFGPLAFDTVIQRNIRLGEAPSHGKPIMLYDASATGAVNYLSLAKEFIKRNRKAKQETK